MRIRTFTSVALVLAVLIIGWSVYGRFFAEAAPGDLAYRAGTRAFEDGDYTRAESDYREALVESPKDLSALRGLARTLHEQGRSEEALTVYGEAIARAPDFGATYADRGVLLDSAGRHEEALGDYMRALKLDPELARGPSWLKRLLRKEPAPMIGERTAYLRAELAKPESERALHKPGAERQCPAVPEVNGSTKRAASGPQGRLFC